jgi:hypothetical protein
MARIMRATPHLSAEEVNPVEHLWEEVREKYLHNRIFESLDDLIEVL